MAVYLVGFALSVGLIALTEKKQRVLFLLGSFFALLIPCLIAGLRADTIGTDVEVYIIKLMESATNAPNLKAYLDDFWFIGYRNQYVADYELGFSLLLYALTKLTHSMPVVLFAIQAGVVVPIYVALARNRKKYPVWLGMLVYYLLFFNATLNMMRQFMAMGLLLLAFQLLLEKKHLPALILSAASLLFHLSAVIAFAVYAIYWFLSWRHNYRLEHNRVKVAGRTVAVILIGVVGMTAVLNLDIILKLMSTLGINRFSNYLKGNALHLMLGQIALRLPVIALFVINWPYLRRHTKAAAFYLTMLILDMVAAQLISVDTFAFRIGFYFMHYMILAIPTLYTACGKGFRRKTTTLLLVAYLLVYWYYTYVMQLRHATIPYEFRVF